MPSKMLRRRSIFLTKFRRQNSNTIGMKTLPIYTEFNSSPLHKLDPLQNNPQCTRCSNTTQAQQHRCMPAVGATGGVYVLTERVDALSAKSGVPLAGAHIDYLRALIRNHWQGNIVVDTAVRCYLPETNFEHAIVNCAPYTLNNILASNPQLVIAIGEHAIHQLLGRSVGTRYGVSWVLNELEAPSSTQYIPVFCVHDEFIGINNFYRKNFEFCIAEIFKNLQTTLQYRKFLEEKYTVVEPTHASVEYAVQLLCAGDTLTFDCETAGVHGNDDFEILCASFTNTEGATVVFPQNVLDTNKGIAAIKKIFSGKKLNGHFLPYDVNCFYFDKRFKLDLIEQMHYDTRILLKLAHGEMRTKLEIAAEIVGMGGHKKVIEQAIAAVERDINGVASQHTRKKPYVCKSNFTANSLPAHRLAQIHSKAIDAKSYAFKFIDRDLLHRYNTLDSLATHALLEKYKNILRDVPHSKHYWESFGLDTLRALTQIMRTGVPIDVQNLSVLNKYLETQLDATDLHLSQYVQGVNWNSPQQVGTLLFEKLQLKNKSRPTATGRYSTDDEALKKIKDQHPVVALILERRRLEKLNGTYAKGIAHAVRDDGRIHMKLEQDSVETGRLSCREPNMQNWPRTEDEHKNTEGKMLRDCIAAPDGYCVIEHDYSQLELRVAAALAQCPSMRDMFLKQGVDMHAATARLISFVWSIKQEVWDTLTDEQRKPYRAKAKIVNFAVHYNKTVKALAADLNCSVDEAQKIVDAILNVFPEVKQAIKWSENFVAKNGGIFVEYAGKPALWRDLWGIGFSDDGKYSGVKSNARNGCWNTRVQGFAGFLTEASLRPSQKAFEFYKIDGYICNTVHDSIISIVSVNDSRKAAKIIYDVMVRQPMPFNVPLEVDVSVGQRWGSLKKLPHEQFKSIVL